MLDDPGPVPSIWQGLLSMDALVRSIAEFFAAIFGVVGFMGKPRRRAGIRDDLHLLEELAEHEDFGRGSWPHQALMHRVSLDVAKLSGVPLGKRRPWPSVILAILIGVPLGYWTYVINQNGFQWYSVFPGIVAALMGVSLLGMLFPSEEEQVFGESGDFDVRPPAGDINARSGSSSDVTGE
jgi:hypothetical protein